MVGLCPGAIATGCMPVGVDLTTITGTTSNNLTGVPHLSDVPFASNL